MRQCPVLTIRCRWILVWLLSAPPACVRLPKRPPALSKRRHLTYVIGTEVPVPGGEASTIGSVHVTRAQDAAATLETH